VTDHGSTSRKALVTFELRDPDPQVLIVTNAWPHAADPTYGIFIKRQVDSLRDIGVRLDVLFVRGYLSKSAYGAAALSLARLSRSGNPPYRLVHAHGGETGLCVPAYRRAPTLVSYLGDDLLGTPRADASFPTTSRLRRAVIRRSAALVSRTITKSHEMQLALPRSRRPRNDVVPNGVDDSIFAPVSRDEARRLLGWEPDARIALFGGNPRIPRKRFWLAQAACEAASIRLPAVQLKTLSGIHPDKVPLVMNAADCLLLTSVVEGSPNVVKEALMCNLPVIATPAGDVRDLLRDVSPSWICAAAHDEIAGALVQCLATPIRSDGRLRSRHLTAGAIAERVLRVYERTLSGESLGLAGEALTQSSTL
jgi:glycosyltransferase involved in cell wall biosynthesis